MCRGGGQSEWGNYIHKYKIDKSHLSLKIWLLICVLCLWNLSPPMGKAAGRQLWVLYTYKTRLGVQQCQAQGLVFSSWLDLIQDRIRVCNFKGMILTGVWMLRTTVFIVWTTFAKHLAWQMALSPSRWPLSWQSRDGTYNSAVLLAAVLPPVMRTHEIRDGSDKDDGAGECTSSHIRIKKFSFKRLGLGMGWVDGDIFKWDLPNSYELSTNVSQCLNL